MTAKIDNKDRMLVDAFASAWASMDGNSSEFERGRNHQDDISGYYEGYIADATELLSRANKRLNSPPSEGQSWHFISKTDGSTISFGPEFNRVQSLPDAKFIKEGREPNG